MPISEFTISLRAQRIAESQFKEGGFVAIVNHHLDRRIVGKRRIVKVYANGNFIITSVNDVPSTKQWRPSGKTAQPAGNETGIRYSEHLEPWTPEHSIEIDQRRAQRRREKRLAVVLATLETMRRNNAKIDEHSLLAVEAALGLLGATAPEVVPEEFNDQG